MPITNASTVVGFDADAAVERIRERIDGTLYSAVEYDTATYQPLYVDDATMAFYEDEAAMDDHFGLIHSHVNLDFTEIGLFTDELFPVADEVTAITTRMDYLKLVRVYGDREGLFLAVEPGEPVEPPVTAVRETLAE